MTTTWFESQQDEAVTNKIANIFNDSSRNNWVSTGLCYKDPLQQYGRAQFVGNGMGCWLSVRQAAWAFIICLRIGQYYIPRWPMKKSSSSSALAGVPY
eukprot:3195281-Amphidinium_carterae.1